MCLPTAVALALGDRLPVVLAAPFRLVFHESVERGPAVLLVDPFPAVGVVPAQQKPSIAPGLPLVALRTLLVVREVNPFTALLRPHTTRSTASTALQRLWRTCTTACC